MSRSRAGGHVDLARQLENEFNWKLVISKLKVDENS